jgi:hypothetical protein
MQSAEAIKATIEAMLCPVHDIYPSVYIVGNEIDIACCCPAFYETCTEQAKKMLSDDDLSDAIIVFG